MRVWLRSTSNVIDVLEMLGAVCVVNGLESHSGSNALKILVAPGNQNGGLFSEVKISGTHVDSLEMIRRGSAGVAAQKYYCAMIRHTPNANLPQPL